MITRMRDTGACYGSQTGHAPGMSPRSLRDIVHGDHPLLVLVSLFHNSCMKAERCCLQALVDGNQFSVSLRMLDLIVKAVTPAVHGGQHKTGMLL